MYLIKNMRILGIISFLFPLMSLLGNENSAQFRAAYFYSTDSRFRDVYSGAGLFSIETNFQVLSKPLVWSSLGFLYASGNSIGEGDGTTLYAFPLALGIKYPFSLHRIRPYLGAGIASVPYCRIYNGSPYVSRHQYGWGIGGIFKSGIMFYVKKAILFDFFLDYTHLDMNFDHSNKVVIKRSGTLSGITAGIGAGYRF